MVFFPNAKINLGLHITARRADGFHDLQTVFYPLPVTDALEVVTAEKAAREITFTLTGMEIQGGENICAKAYRLLKKDFPQLPPVLMHLHKTIPVGAGLGGGSADGAFTLLLLNKKYGLQLTEQQLLHNALQLGSDCPFFIKNTPCLAFGRGEQLQPINLQLSAYKICIVNPGIHINTGWAFSQLTPRPPQQALSTVIQKDPTEWKHVLFNDFEPPIFEHYPEIRRIKETLYEAGAVFAAMSGSGSTVFGLFAKEAQPAIAFPPHYFVKECYL